MESRESIYAMRCLTSIVAILLIPLSAAAAAPAAAATTDSVWTLTTGDFQSRVVRLLAMDQSGARVVPVAAAGDGEEQFIPIDRFLEISRADQSPASAGENAKALVLELVDGDRLLGRPAGMSSENLIWTHPLLGDVVVPLRHLRSLGRADERLSAPARLNPPDPANPVDVVSLVNGDAVRGIVTDLQPGAISIMPAASAAAAAGDGGGDGEQSQSISVAMETVRSVSFASVDANANPSHNPQQDGNADTSGSRRFRLRLTDGSALTVSSAQVAGEEARVSTAPNEPPRAVPLPQVAAIEQIGGPVLWLSSLTPLESVQVPFVGDPWPARMDRTVTGDPIRVRQRVYSHGIGVHAYSRLKFRLDAFNGAAPDSGYRAFRTQYAIDDDNGGGGGAYADVTVRIKLDDRVAYEQAHVRADSSVASGSGSRSLPTVTIALGEAKTITLEVDYGQNYDVQDRFNWIEPALLKSPPTTQPTPPQ